MGLADFLANAAEGGLGAAMGGKSSSQRAQEDFINVQLPALLQEIHANTDETKIPEFGQRFILSAAKAGMSPQGAEKLMEMTIGPALQGVRREGLNKLFDQYAGKPAQPAQFTTGGKFADVPLAAPPSGPAPITPRGNFADATPDKPLDLNFIKQFGQLTNANPTQFNQMLGTPAEIAGKQLSNQKTQQAIDQDMAKEKAIQGLPKEPSAEWQPSPEQVARLPGGLVNFLPNREDSQSKQDFQNQSLNLKLLGMENQVGLANQKLELQRDRTDNAGSVARTRQATTLRKEFNTLSKNFRDVGDSYNRVEAALKSNDPMSQVAAVYNFIKQQDPNIVTGSEFRLIENARPLLDKYGLRAFERLWKGEILDPGQVSQLRNASKNLYEAAGRQHQQRVQEYSRLAEQNDINPRDVITEMGVQPAPAAPAGPAQAPAQGQQLDAQGAAAILKEAGGDKNKAREIAKQRGYRF